MPRRLALVFASSVALCACGSPDKAASDTVVADTGHVAASVDTPPAPRIVPYNPSAPGAMRSGDTPIKPATLPAPQAKAPSSTSAAAAPRASSPAPTPTTAGVRSSTAQRASAPVPVDSVGDPAAVVRAYYAAIRSHDFMKAYRMWETSGQRNARSFSQFEAGFDSTESVDAKPGEPGRIEGAAGSRYVTVPVEIDSRLRNGTRQRFSGTYTLRRVVVPGASTAERRWHLYAANIRQVR